MKKSEDENLDEVVSQESGSIMTISIVGLFIICLMFVSFQKNLSVALDIQQSEIIKYKTYLDEKNSLEEVRACAGDDSYIVLDEDSATQTASVYAGDFK